MISLSKLELSNFVTYKDQVFDFDELFKSDNKILISGRNLDDSTFANDNGAGKSLIHESILFSLFNRTTQNSNRDLLVGEHKKSMSVGLTLFNEQGDKFWIKRYRKDKVYGNGFRLKINDEEKFKTTATALSEYFLRILGISYQRIINTSIFESQDERSRFVYLGDKAAKTLLAQIKGIDIFILCQKIANDKKSEIEKEIEKIKQEVSNYRWKLNELKEERKSSKLMSKRFEKIKEDKISEIKRTKEKREENFKNLIEELEGTKDNLDISLKKLKLKLKKSYKIKPLEDELASLKNDKSKLISSKDIAVFEYNKARQTYRSLKNQKIGSVCNKCGSQITKQTLIKYKAQVTKKASVSKDTIVQFEREISELETKEEELKTKINNFHSKNQKNETKLFHIKSKRNEIEYKLESERKKFSSFCDFFEKQIYEMKQEENLHKRDIKNINKRISDIKEKLNTLNDELNSLRPELPYLKAWASGYDKERIQSYALQSTVIQLNKEIQRISDILTDGLIEIELLTQKKQGNKIVRNIFELKISDLSKEGKPFKNWSKGQKRRIEIILSFALLNIEKNLMAEVFLDELFDGIDQVGVSKVILLLNNEIQNAKRFIVLSHFDNVKNLFSNKGIVTLKNGISKFSLQ